MWIKMDEVDIDNMEDLNELEARLYAQIHHEPTNAEERANDGGQGFNATNNNEAVTPNYEVSSHTNRILSRRYWSDNDSSQRQQDRSQHHHQLIIQNPFKTPIQQKKSKVNQQPRYTENSAKTVLNPIKGNKKINSPVQNNNDVNAENTTTTKTNAFNTGPAPSVNDRNKNNNKNASANSQPQTNQRKQPTKESNLKLNPIADWMKRKKNNVNKKSNGKNSTSTNIKQGLFSRQQQKLEKAKRIEERKKRSKKPKNTAAEIATKLKVTDIIDLDSDNESDSSDIIIIPVPPPPTFTVEDSDEEDEADKVNITMEHEENAVDSNDVQLSLTTGSFIKPKEVSTQSLITADNEEKRLENSSRCTSPCSIQSSDDFIRNIDRIRLLAGGRGMADDEDLLELTSDMNILAEPSDLLKQSDKENVCMDKNKTPLNDNQQVSQEENLEFATPKAAGTQSRDYRVDQSQFKALDVYESESDIADSVYSKGAARKATVIRQIDSSSDDVEDISACSQRTKRLRKRRASSSNKESDHNNCNLLSSSDNDEIENDNQLLRTPVPYIAKGIAVERYKPQKRHRILSSCSSHIQKSKSPETTAPDNNTSDTEFLATLNNLAQGQDEEQENQNVDESEESETENFPTAREIAEKILSQNSAKANVNKTFTDDMALPETILNDLGKVFDRIDQLDRQNCDSVLPIDDAYKVSDSSDSDREKDLIYPSVPNEDAQIIKYLPKNSVPQTHDANGSPIYNVIYIRGARKPGGIGWNDEMRKFYNESWNGEKFLVSKVQQQMNPEKSLWKIYTEDRFNIKPNKRNNIKCTNCCEFGHKRSKCKRRKKPLLCYMCGESGHYEPRCPNTICLRCGNKTQVFTRSCNACSYLNRLTCPICKIRGHSLEYCPDKWRRYHSTTEANVHPSSKVDYNPRKYCCICGGRGHISDSCRSSLRFLEYPAISSSIKSHLKSYNDVVVRTPSNGIAVNLMYEPCHQYNLDFVQQTSLDKYYGRFLKAVGLEFLLSRKRYSGTVASESSESNAKRAKRLSKKYEANPYLKAATAKRKNNKSMENAPNQVQEITESGNIDHSMDENRPEEAVEVINVEDKSEDEVEAVEVTESNLEELPFSIQLNTINEKSEVADSNYDNFKSPKDVATASTEKTYQHQMEPSLMLDSDSNYSFSEHFDIASSQSNDVAAATEGPIMLELPATESLTNSQEVAEGCLTADMSRPKTREMEPLPDFIPLIDSTEDQNGPNNDIDNFRVGISRQFVAAESDNEEEEERSRNLSPSPELPCEAKIYLTHFHTKYLLSPQGSEFLIKTTRAHKLKARLDFTSVGYVLIIFGLPANQNKFQRELLLKYRELEDEANQKQIQNSINVPKRTFFLIKFLRENITQLLSNLGNVNYLLRRLHFLEKQQTKSCFKSAEKIRRSLNMILVGQAGLQDGTMHLDKLLMSLKTLLNDVTDDVAPPELRSEITNHWKVIFSAYRHDNYQKLVETYNKLVSKNRLPQLNIDPILLGQRVLDTRLTEEQKQKMEQPRMQGPSSTELSKQTSVNTFNQTNAKNSKIKQTTDTSNVASKTSTNETTTANGKKTKVTSLRADDGISSAPSANTKKRLTSNNTRSPLKNTAKTMASSTNSTSKSPTIDEASKKQPQKQTGPPTLSHLEKCSTVSTAIQKVSDNWKSTCDTLLTQISSENSIDANLSDQVRDSRIPSMFWSREAMRYLDDCIALAAARRDVVEKLQRVQNKSKNGQLSYNDYLAVIKLHTALNGK